MDSEALLSPSSSEFNQLPSPTSLASPTSSSSSLSPASSPSSPFSSYRLLFGVRHPPHALNSFFFLFLIHLLNYADRFIPSAVKLQLQEHFDINDFWSSFSLTAFIIVFMLFSPIFGYLTDKGWNRQKLIAGSVALWSVLTIATAFSPNYATFIVIRALLGIGESCYITVAPSILADWSHH